ncbi:hypothetical protein HZS_5345, partial [Henneguya salminicola]
NLSMNTVECCEVYFLTTKNFKQIWITAYLYILSLVREYRLIVYKTRPVFHKTDIVDSKINDIDIVIISKTIDSRTTAKNLTVRQTNKLRSPTKYVLLLEFNIYTKIKIAMENSNMLSQWTKIINTLIEESKQRKYHTLELIKKMFLKPFSKKKPKKINSENIFMPTHYRQASDGKPNTEIFHVYRITTEPPSDEFDYIYKALIHFTDSHIILTVVKDRKDGIILKWKYNEIKRHGVFENNFCIEVFSKDSGEGKTHDKTSTIYYFTVDKENLLQDAFKKRTLRITGKTRRATVRSSSIEHHPSLSIYNLKSVKSDIIRAEEMPEILPFFEEPEKPKENEAKFLPSIDPVPNKLYYNYPVGENVKSDLYFPSLVSDISQKSNLSKPPSLIPAPSTLQIKCSEALTRSNTLPN